MNARLAALASFASVVLASSVAAAQYGPPPPPPPMYPMAAPPAPFPDRQGFTIGFAVGGGQLSAETLEDYPQKQLGMGFSLRLGVAVRQNLLLQGELGFSAESYEEGNDTQLNFFGATASYYVHPRIYLVGGIGVGELIFGDVDGSDDDDFDDKPRAAAANIYREVDGGTSGALLVGAGVELFQTPSFGLSLEWRAIIASYDEDESVVGNNLMLGFQWF